VFNVSFLNKKNVIKCISALLFIVLKFFFFSCKVMEMDQLRGRFVDEAHLRAEIEGYENRLSYYEVGSPERAQGERMLQDMYKKYIDMYRIQMQMEKNKINSELDELRVQLSRETFGTEEHSAIEAVIMRMEYNLNQWQHQAEARLCSVTVKLQLSSRQQEYESSDDDNDDDEEVESYVVESFHKKVRRES